jgi:hypothetical protein
MDTPPPAKNATLRGKAMHASSPFRVIPAFLILLVAALFGAAPALAQKGMGDPWGVARLPVKPPVLTLSGTVVEVTTGPCEATTGRSFQGTHLLVRFDDGRAINLHLGPAGAAAVDELAKVLSAGMAIRFEAFRTNQMPVNAYIAKTVWFGEEDVVVLRDDNLRPRWTLRRGGRGRIS